MAWSKLANDPAVTSAKIATSALQRRLAYTTRTSTYTASSQTVGSAADIFSSDLSITADGTSAYRFVFFAPDVYHENSSNAAIYVALVKGDGTLIGLIGSRGRGDGVATGHSAVSANFLHTPASGTQTFNARAYYVTNASGGNPAVNPSTDLAISLAIFSPDIT
jgi:hypothetical protein